MFQKTCGWISILIFTLLVSASAATADTQPKPQLQSQVLSLETCLKLGFENSKDLQKQDQNIKVSQENVRKAQAGFNPNVNYSVNDTQQNSNSNGSSANVPTGTLSLTFPSIFNQRKLSDSLKVAQFQLESAREDERQTKLQLTYDVKSAFYDLWLKEQQLKVAQSSYDNLGQHYQTVQKYFQVGKKSKYELLEAEVAWKEQKAALISAQNSVSLAKLALALLIGIDKDQDFQISYDASWQQIPDQIALKLNVLLDQAYQQRPDARQSAQDIEIAALNLAVQKAANNPSLSLSSTYAGGSGSQSYWQFTLGVSGKLYDGSVNASAIKALEEKVTLAKISDAKTRDNIRKTVQNAFQTAQVDLETAHAYQANIDLSKEALRMTEIRYGAGMSTILDVKDAQLSVDKAADNYYAYVAAYLKDLAKLDLESGKE